MKQNLKTSKFYNLVIYLQVISFAFFFQCSSSTKAIRVTENFNSGWRFFLGEAVNPQDTTFDDSKWRLLDLPHDWSIEGEFSESHPATAGGGALPGGLGWYRKTFKLEEDQKEKLFFIDFDGVYRNSEVWINGHKLGFRPNGYISFRYDLTEFLNFGEKENTITVKVDNSQQPNSRWYSGSGIYRNVWLVSTDKIYVDKWGTFVTTPQVDEKKAAVSIATKVRNATGQKQSVKITTSIYDASGNKITSITSEDVLIDSVEEVNQGLTVENPKLWSVEHPALYKAVTEVESEGNLKDQYVTSFGIRYFKFDSEKGFSLNGEAVKIKGVCNHHDLGALGAAVNTRALERQLEILREMGVNAIRTSHNPPAPELLDLCDKLGFIVMDEMFDMWKKNKSPYDYALYWDEWHEKDLTDFILRDRNHPSVIMWSIGNEILEQWDSTGIPITKELVGVVKRLDTTRAITAACNPPSPTNNLIKPMALDLIGYNYAHKSYEDFPKIFPGQKFIATETSSALATRGHYDMPSDSIRRWPYRWDLLFTEGNPDWTVSAYDNVSAPWGSTHEETWKIIKKHDYMSGMFIWTGFDYLGEPTPYTWPARSSYFGVVDLAGFPKDAYYMYQSEWTDKDVLHIYPHWNWEEGKIVDVWAYYSNADEVELLLNGKSLGTKKKEGEDLHVMWRIPYQPGTLKAISRKNGKDVLVKEVKTAGDPAKIILESDRADISADGNDLSFITVKIVDKDGNIVPKAGNLVKFTIDGPGVIVGVDNGNPVSLESFKVNYRKAFNGKCLAIIKAEKQPGVVKLTATSEGLQDASIEVKTN